jgi:hypothetical protein
MSGLVGRLNEGRWSRFQRPFFLDPMILSKRGSPIGRNYLALGIASETDKDTMQNAFIASIQFP